MRAWLLSAKVPEASPRQKRDIAQMRRKSRWVMANLSRMRGSISLDDNEVCHVVLLVPQDAVLLRDHFVAAPASKTLENSNLSSGQRFRSIPRGWEMLKIIRI